MEQSILAKVKQALRISHSALDEDLQDTIKACLADLDLCGVNTDKELDPLILNAIKLYCRKEYTDDVVKATEYQKRYDALKSCLMMSTLYRRGEADE